MNVRRGTLRLIFTDTTTGNGPISTSTPVTLGEPGFGATLDINEAVVGSYPDSSPIIEPVTQSLANLSIDGGGGQSLMGSGTIGGAATIAGIHSPGNSPGIETFTSNLTYSSGSSQVIWELWGNTASNSPTVAYDQIVVGGDLDFAGATSLSLVFSGTGSSVDWDNPFWGENRSWLLFDVAGTTSNRVNNFSLAGGPSSWLDASGQAFADSLRKDNSFTVTQQGNDVYVNYTVVIPEPSSIALAGVGIAAAAWAARRRMRP